MARDRGLNDRSVVIVDGCRTPFQRAATGFVDSFSYQLAAATVRGLLDRTGLSPSALDRVIFGATVHNPAATNVAREAALIAGVPAEVPAHTVTAAGASATVAFSQAADLILTGQAEVVIAGGTDCVSDPPIGYSRAMRTKLLRGRRLKTVGQKLRFALGLRPWDFLPDIPEVRELSTGRTMGQYTEELVSRLGISRVDQDAYAAQSHRRATAAVDHLRKEIVCVEVSSVEGSGTGAEQTVITEDNGIRPKTTVEQLAKLPPSFSRNGTLTAGNSSYLTDGASALLVMSEARARAEGLPIQARLRGRAFTAHDPGGELLLGPVFAAPKALEDADLELEDIGVFELHEAFAAQILAVVRLLESDLLSREILGRDRALGPIPMDRLNRWGGSLAIGNPFAPNGARLLTTAAHRLLEEDQEFALVATCAGGALGHGLVLERV